MADPITIAVEFEGAEDASSAAGRVSDGLDAISMSALDATRKSLEVGNQVRELSTRLLGTVNAVGSLAQAFGRASAGGGDGLVPRMTALTDTVGQVASLFGPTGALVGGITMLAGRAIPTLLEALMGVPPAQEAVEEATRRASTEIREQASAADEAAGALDRFISSVSTAGRRRELAVLGEQIADLTDQLMRARASGDAATRLGAFDIEDQIRRLQGQAEDMRGELEGEGAFAPPRRQSSGRRERERDPLEDFARFQDEQLGFYDTMQSLIDEVNASERERGRLIEENAQKAREAREGEMELAREQKDREIEELERLTEEHRKAQEEMEESSRAQQESVSEVTGVIVGGLTDALTAIVSGQKSAEEAFKGLLASFLSYIAEQASLRAIFEFAEAISSFASYKYDQGVQHLAAGAAFTAVAVAAGAGSAALSASGGGASAASRPSGPENRDRGDQGGGSITVLFNSPVVSAQTTAQLGRQLGQMVAAGERRFG